MPQTRSQAAGHCPADEQLGQVTFDSVSCHGSQRSLKSNISRAQSLVMKAELKKKQLISELRLQEEELELRKKRMILEAQNELEMARLTLFTEKKWEERMQKRGSANNQQNQLDCDEMAIKETSSTSPQVVQDLKSTNKANSTDESVSLTHTSTCSGVSFCDNSTNLVTSVVTETDASNPDKLISEPQSGVPEIASTPLSVAYQPVEKPDLQSTTKVGLISTQLRCLYDDASLDVHSLPTAPSVDNLKVADFVTWSVSYSGGRIVVPLPWKEKPANQFTIYNVARVRILRLRKCSPTDERFCQTYICVTKRNFELGYAVPIPREQIEPSFRPKWYLPHHAVVDLKKRGNLRILFDYAARHGHKSLNDLLCQGPDINSRVLKTIPPTERSPNLREIEGANLPSQRSLGIEWDAESDEFRIRINLSHKAYTRQGLLSCIATLFDPLGFVAPWLIPGKLLLQSLSKSGRGWDEPVNADQRRQWDAWNTSLQALGEIRIPRPVMPKEMVRSEDTELHVFCDASESAYGAVVYACFVTVSGSRHCSLLMSKARVAPSKPVSIPRLELVAAVLGVRLLNNLVNHYDAHFRRIYLWTESIIVLYYLHNSSTRFCTCVANRVAYIQETTNPGQWRHVNDESNPADLASRGTRRHKDIAVWVAGPPVLKSPPSTWPERPQNLIKPAGLELKRATKSVHAISQDCRTTDMLRRFSDWTT